MTRAGTTIYWVMCGIALLSFAALSGHAAFLRERFDLPLIAGLLLVPGFVYGLGVTARYFLAPGPLVRVKIGRVAYWTFAIWALAALVYATVNFAVDERTHAEHLMFANMIGAVILFGIGRGLRFLFAWE